MALEAATKDTKQLQTAMLPATFSNPIPVHEVRGTERSPPNIKCFRCGKPNHKAPECRFKDSVCTKCNKKKHLAKVCRSSSSTPHRTPGYSSQSGTRPVQTNTVISSTEVPEEYQLFSIQQADTSNHGKPLTLSVTINGKLVQMEIDTGSAVSIISESVYKTIFETQISEALQDTEAKLCTYSGEHLPVKGKIICEVTYE